MNESDMMDLVDDIEKGYDLEDQSWWQQLDQDEQQVAEYYFKHKELPPSFNDINDWWPYKNENHYFDCLERSRDMEYIGR